MAHGNPRLTLWNPAHATNRIEFFVASNPAPRPWVSMKIITLAEDMEVSELPAIAKDFLRLASSPPGMPTGMRIGMAFPMPGKP